MMRTTTPLLAGLTLLALSSQAWAEDERGAREIAPSHAFAQKAPTDSDTAAANRFQITATKGESEVTLKFGDGDEYGDNLFGRTSDWSVAISVPLGEGKSAADLATLDDIGDGLSVEASWRFTRVSAGTPNERELLADCARLRREGDTSPCDAEFFKRNDGEHYDRYLDLAWGKNPLVVGGGATITIDHDDHDYLDATTLKDRSEEKTSASLKAFVTIQPLRRQQFFEFSYKRSISWEDQDEVILCPAGGGVLTCKKGAGGPPSKTERDLVSAEYRQGFGKNFALSFKLSYDARNDVTGADLPLYFVKDGNGGLSGGVRFGWRSDTDDTMAAIFIGAPLPFGD
jgi:hypothetical protein